MGVVANGAAHAEGGVHDLLREHSLVVAGVTEVGYFGRKKFRIFARMGVMTAGAAHADGRMDGLLFEHRFIMAAVAQFRLLRGQTPGYVVRLFVRYVRRVDPRVARGTSHRDCRMGTFLRSKISVALETIYLLTLRGFRP